VSNKIQLGETSAKCWQPLTPTKKPRALPEKLPGGRSSLPARRPAAIVFRNPEYCETAHFGVITPAPGGLTIPVLF
jgi:hypothetical protein